MSRKRSEAVRKNGNDRGIGMKREKVHGIDGPGKIMSLGPNRKMYEKRFSIAINEKKVVPFECPICRGELEIEVDFRCMGVSGSINLDTVCPLCSTIIKGSLKTADD